MHPLRRAAPDQKGCNSYGSGAPAPTTSTTAGFSSPQNPTGYLGRCDTASKRSPRLRTRGAAPVTSRCTRYVALHPIRRGVIPTDRVHRLLQQARLRAFPPHRPQPSASDTATQPRNARPGSAREALHHLGSIRPPLSWCNTPLSGVTPLSYKPTRCLTAPAATPNAWHPFYAHKPPRLTPRQRPEPRASRAP